MDRVGKGDIADRATGIRRPGTDRRRYHVGPAPLDQGNQVSLAHDSLRWTATFLLLSSNAAAQSEPTQAGTILERNAAHVGGRIAVDAAGDLEMHGTIHGGAAPMPYRAFLRRQPFAFRQEILAARDAPPLLVRITDGRHAWRVTERGTEVLPAVHARLLIEAAFLEGMRWLEPGDQDPPAVVGGIVTLPGMSGVPGGLGAHGRLRDVQFAPGGANVHLLFDEATGTLRAMVCSSVPPFREVRLGDWRRCGPLLVPMLRWEFQDGQAMTLVLERVETSAALDPVLFAGSPQPTVPPLLRIGDLWPLPDAVPDSVQFAVPAVGIGQDLAVVALVDTGASTVFVSPAVADRAGLAVLNTTGVRSVHGTASASRRWLDELRVGPFTERQLLIEATALPKIAALSMREQPAMILGGPLLFGRSPIFDLEHGGLWLRGSPVVPLGEGDRDRPPVRTVPLRRRAGSSLPIVDLAIGDQRIEALLDTGQGIALRFTAAGLERAGLPTDPAVWKERGAIVLASSGAGGQAAEELLVRLPSMQLGSVRWEQPYVLLSLAASMPFDAALGGGALWHFARVGIDAERQLLELEPRADLVATGEVLLIPEPGGFAGMIVVPAPIEATGESELPIVHLVVPGTPAAMAGVRAGDRLRSVDGRPCRGLAPRQFLDRLWLRGEVAIELLRADGTSTTVCLR